MRGILWALLAMAPLAAFAADETARKDINRNFSELGLTDSNELRNIRVSETGRIKVDVDAGTVTANQGKAGTERWLMDISTPSSVQSFQAGTWDVNLATSAPAAVRDSKLLGRNYVYRSQDFTGTGSLAFSGIGSSWLVSAKGGQVTFNIDGGNDIVLRSGDAIFSDFKLVADDPVITITGIDPGATALVFIDGVQ